MFSYILGLLAGASSPVQASVNSRIREYLKSPYITSVVNFISSSLAMILLVLAVDRNLQIPFADIAQQPWWIWLGGTCGTAIVFLNIICLPKLGSAGNVMLICFGQTMTGLLIDHFGMFGAVQIDMSLARLLGALLVIAGIALVNGIFKTSAGGSKSEAGEARRTSIGEFLIYSALAMLCGFACAAQVAINGTLKGYAGSAFKATLLSMNVGFISAVILTVIVIAMKGKYGIYDGGADHGPVEFRWWMPIGGMLAINIVAGNAVIAPVLGTGLATILNLVGMMGISLAIDATGFLGIEKQPVTLVKVAGMIMMIAGAVIITFL